VLLLDCNLLIYAIDSESPHFGRAHQWWQQVLNGDELILLPWITLLAFIRLTTNPRIFSAPLSIEQATQYIDDWLAQPQVVAVDASDEIWPALGQTLTETGSSGNLTNDAFLAMLAIRRGAKLCSADHDFKRFKGLRVINPLV